MLLIFLQLATILFTQQEQALLCAGPLTSECHTYASLPLLAKERPSASLKEREGKSIHVSVLASSLVLLELGEIQQVLVSIFLS